jgi:hypothetical protein
MSNLSSGTALGGAYVEIGANITGLESGEQKAKQIAGRISNLRSQVKLELDTTAASGAVSRFTGQLQSVGGIASRPMKLSVEVDTASLSRAKSAIAEVMKGGHAMVTLQETVNRMRSGAGLESSSRSAAKLESIERDALVMALNNRGNRIIDAARGSQITPANLKEIDRAKNRAADQLRAQLESADELERTGIKGFQRGGKLVPADEKDIPYRNLKANLESNARDGVSNGIARGAEDGAAKAGRHFDPAKSNLLSERGLGRLLGSMTAVYAAEQALRLTASFVDADNAALHPERQIESLSGFGDRYNLVQDPMVKRQGAVLAENSGRRKEMEALESIPVFGSLFQLDNAVMDAKGKLDDQDARAKRVIQGRQQLLAMDDSTRLRGLELEGNEVAVAQENEDQKLRPLRNEGSKVGELRKRADAVIQADYKKQLADDVFDEADGPVARKTIDQLDPTLAGEIANAQDAYDKLRAAEKQSREYIARVRASMQARVMGQLGSVYSSGLRTGGLNLETLATGLESSFAPGSEGQARQLRQQALLKNQAAEREDFKRARDIAVANPKLTPEEKEHTKQEQGGKERELLAAQAKARAEFGKQTAGIERENQRIILAERTEGNVAQLRADRNFFQADVEAFAAASKAKREELAGKSPDTLDEFDQNTQKLRTALYQTRQTAQRLEFADASDNIRAAQFRGQRRDFEASQLKYDGQDREAQLIPTALQRGMKLAEIDSNRQADIQLHARDVQLEDMNRGARGAAADAVIANTPLTARAIMDVDRAKQVVESVAPDRRDAEIATQRKILSADEHELTGFRGGAIVRAGSRDEALALTGFGMDLDGSTHDRKLAGANLALGKANLGAKLPGSATDAGNQALIEAAKQMVAILKKAIGNTSFISPG